jgi:hypothetical protein
MAFTVPQLMNLAPETKPAFTPAQREKMPQFIFDPNYPTDTTTGTTETSGTTATTGTSGTTATTGTSGTTATTGTSGTTATTGTSGTTATTGTSGSTATTGTSGSTATTGTSGSTATTGTSGTTGTTTTTETPVEVTVDATGEVEMPKATLDIPASEGVTTEDVQVDVADLTKPLVVNGETTPPVTEQMAEQLPGFDVTQENGVVNVTGTGDNTGVVAALVPEKVVTDATAKPGMSTDANGNYVVTTKAGLQITFLSAPKDPVVLYKALKGKSGKDRVKIKKHGGVLFSAPRGKVSAKFSPFVEKAPAGMTVGVTFNGGSGTVVYPDGTMQQIAPAMPEPTALDSAVRALLAKLGLAVTITFTYNADGTANFTYPSGQAARIVPTFDVKPATTGTTATSGATETTATSGATETTATSGTTATEVQPTVELKDASTAEITTSEGTQELKIVPVEETATGTTATSGTADTTSTTTGTTGPSEAPMGTTGTSETTTGTTAPSDTATGTTAPSDTATGTTAPSDTATGTTAPSDTATGTTAPSDTTMGTTAPSDTATGTTAPSDTTMGTTAPSDTATGTTAPSDTATGTTAPGETTTGTTSTTGTTG